MFLMRSRYDSDLTFGGGEMATEASTSIAPVKDVAYSWFLENAACKGHLTVH